MARRKRALIFGVTGQDGAYLSRLLVDKGYVVHGTSRDRDTASLEGLRFTGVEGRVTLHSADLRDARNVLQAFREARPDEVYNLSGQNSVSLSFEQPAETYESIVKATLNLLEIIRFSWPGVRLFNAASGECFGELGARRADEHTAFHPRSPYGVAKAAAYWMAVNYREAYGVGVSSGIMFNHESPVRPERYVTRKVVAAAARIAAGSGETLRLGNLNIRRDWGWAPDYVDAMWRMLQRSTPGDYVIATGRSVSLREFVAQAFAAFGLRWQRHVRIDPSLYRPSDIASNGGNAALARRALRWRPTRLLPEIVRAMAAAELARPGLTPLRGATPRRGGS